MFRTALISMFLTSAALADTWTVDDDGKADFNNIQAAVDASSDGDEIIVMPGTYTGSSYHVLNMLGKAVSLSGTPGKTIIDGEGVRGGILCENGETSKTVLQGFTITNCSQERGAGLYCDGSSPLIIDCIFKNNVASQWGGAVYATGGASPSFDDCRFEINEANNGGGIGIHNNFDGAVAFLDCVFRYNTADSAGGAIMDNNSGSLSLIDCDFVGNTANVGGAVRLKDNLGPDSFDGCRLVANIASSAGGALAIQSSNTTLTDTTVCGNTPDQISGDYTDGGGNTIADVCPTGACCVGIPGHSGCIDIPEASCDAGGGVYQGDGSACDHRGCGYTTCVSDIDGSGAVDVADLLAVIDQWGLTDSPADLNGDGIVNVTDLLEVVGNWGPCE